MIALALVLSLVLTLQAGGAPARDSAPVTPVQMGLAVQPETVTVGQHFLLQLRVHAPKGSEIGFPVGPDSGLAVEAVDPRVERRAADTTVTDRTALYRLVAWRTGTQRIVLGPLVVSTGGVSRRFETPDVSVVVRSVRPADSTGTVPRPARTVIVAPRVLWPWILGGALALVLLIWVLRRWLRRRPRRVDEGSGALAVARTDFARIDALGLLEAGERGRYVALHVDAMRAYLARRIPEAARSRTSTELLAALRADAPVPLPRLVPVLAAADLIKYANRPVSDARARELAAETRGIVLAVEEAVLHRAHTAAKPERAA